MKEPNFAPIYACLYPELAKIARKHGYALAVHGSLIRDMDITCIPWIEYPSEPQAVVDEICSTFAIEQVGLPEDKNHGRIAYAIAMSFGECFIDISFMPIKKKETHHLCPWCHKTLDVAQVAKLNVDRYGSNPLVKTICCGKPVRLNKSTKTIIFARPCVTKSDEDDFGEKF